MSLNSADITASLDAFDDISITDIIDSIAYQGFDVATIFNAAWKIVKKKPENKNLLAVLISLGLFRGFGGNKTIDQIAGKSSAVGAAKIKSACNVFGIKLGKPSTRDTITIPRLMICFPKLTYTIWNKQPINKVTTYGGALPLEFRYPGSPSVMPHDMYLEHKNEYVAWSVHLSTLWKNPTSVEDAVKFADLSYANIILNEDQRLAMFE